MYDLKEDYMRDIIKPIEDEVKKLRELKVKRGIFWTRKNEEELERKEEFLLERYEKLGELID